MANPVDTYNPPRHVPGEGMAKIVNGMPLWVKAETINIASLSYGAATQLFSVPANTFVYDIRAYISQAFDNSMQGTIGDGDDPDRFMDNGSLVPGTVGWKSMLQDTQPGSGGHIYTAADTIDLTTSTGSPSAGSLDAYLFYIPNVDENKFS